MSTFFSLFIENLTFTIPLHCSVCICYVLPIRIWYGMSKCKAINLCSCILQQHEPAQLFLWYICIGGDGGDGGGCYYHSFGRVWSRCVRGACIDICVCSVDRIHQLPFEKTYVRYRKMLYHVQCWREICVIFVLVCNGTASTHLDIHRLVCTQYDERKKS